MRKMVGWSLVNLSLVTTGLLSPALALSQGLPEGEGRDIMIQACTACHGLGNITNPHKQFTSEEWEFYLYDMIARGAPVHEEDVEVLKEYLVDNFAIDQVD